MASLLEDSRTCYIAGGALATCVTLLAAWHYMNSRAARKRAERRKAYPANTVILHQMPGRGPYAPSISPFPMKLETYLRMAKIPYQNEYTMERSSKHKTPWITYNGEDLADSQFCIDFLSKKLNKDMNGHLDKEQKAVARAMQKMVDESLYWVFGIERWVYNIDNYKFIKMAIPGIPTFLFKRTSSQCRTMAHGQGYGRHTAEEVYSIGRGDLQTLSDYLGTKTFLMGDQPCEADCAIFGMLAQFKWHTPGTPMEKMLKVDFPVLWDYCERMKDRFWPDWDECITAGGTREATK